MSSANLPVLPPRLSGDADGVVTYYFILFVKKEVDATKDNDNSSSRRPTLFTVTRLVSRFAIETNSANHPFVLLFVRTSKKEAKTPNKQTLVQPARYNNTPNQSSS